MPLRRTYLPVLALTVCIAIIATVLITILFDPYGTFRLVTMDQINRVKPNPTHDIVTIKAHALRHVRPNALILGNSRAEVGFNPAHPIWHRSGYTSVYNAAIRGSSLGTALEMLQTSAYYHPPKLILLGIDFFDFLITPNATLSRKTSDEDWRNEVRWFLRATLTMQALLDSVTTLLRQFQKNPDQLTDLGHTPLDDYRDLARHNGYWTLFRQRAEENAKNHSRKPANLFLQGTQSSPTFDDLRRLVRYTVESKSEMRIVIYPYHAQLMVMIDELGLWPTFDEWKRQVLHIVGEEAQAEARQHIVVLDFSGFSDFARERIPAKGDKTSVTQWYWEAGHFKKELGDRMLEQCLSIDPMQHTFGVVVTEENLATHLARLWAAKTAFRDENTEMVDEIRALVVQAKRYAHTTD